MKKFKALANKTVFRYPSLSFASSFLLHWSSLTKLGRFWINWIEFGKDGIPSTNHAWPSFPRMMIVIIVRDTINQSNNRPCMTWLSSSMRQFAPSSLLEPSSLTRSENECGGPRPNPHLPPFLYPLLQFDHPQPFLLYVLLLKKMSLIQVIIPPTAHFSLL